MNDDRAVVELTSPDPVDAVVVRIEGALARAGLQVFGRVDHAANARAAGLEMPAAVVLIFGAARGGTPIMLANPNLALDLPLRVLVRAAADGGSVIVQHPASTFQSYGVAGPLIEKLTIAQQVIVKAVGL